MKNSFAFVDSSGIIKQDRFFGVGILVTKNVGSLSDVLVKNRQGALNTNRANRQAVVDALLQHRDVDQAMKILQKSKRFEMKFDNVRPSMSPYYLRMLDAFFLHPDNIFSAMIIDRENPKFNAELVHDTWEAYTGFTAALVKKEMEKLEQGANLSLVVDEITRPQSKPLPLEDVVMKKTATKLKRSKYASFSQLTGVLSIESHSNQLMQLTDVLLGAVMFDFKDASGLNTEGTKRKKEAVVQHLRDKLGVSTLAAEIHLETPTHFTVFEANLV